MRGDKGGKSDKGYKGDKMRLFFKIDCGNWEGDIDILGIQGAFGDDDGFVFCIEEVIFIGVNPEADIHINGGAAKGVINDIRGGFGEKAFYRGEGIYNGRTRQVKIGIVAHADREVNPQAIRTAIIFYRVRQNLGVGNDDEATIEGF